MERMGLVSRMAEELERMIGQGQLPVDGSLPSEQTLARRYGVSRGTVREALRRLAARGLVVQHPGRKSRAVALEEAVTLENLGLVLHAKGRAHPERRQWLEGYLALKRDTAVELLAACCEHASQADLGRLGESCFALGEAVRWEKDRSTWAKREFDLLRLAARVAGRPGHFLLIQSLEKAFWGMADQVLPHLDPKALYSWVQCALHALSERSVQELRRALPALLQTRDERLLGSLELACEADGTPAALLEQPLRVGHSDLELAQWQGPDPVSPNLYDCRTGLCQAPPTERSPPVFGSADSGQPLSGATTRDGGTVTE
jgi:GntR family transcriptional repressor for pyruvate dehydrogenase complex